MYGLALPALATLFANLTAASIDLGWKMPNASSSMKEITFPISMNSAPHMDGYYFVQQFTFKGILDIAYTSLQPWKFSNSASIVHVAFSSFIEGTESDDNLCSGGTDGSSTGVSCKKDIVRSYLHSYNITMKNVKGTTWEGTLVDAATKNSTHVGSFMLPSKAGGITTSNMGFVEYFPWNSGGDKSCNSAILPGCVWKPMVVWAGSRGNCEEANPEWRLFWQDWFYSEGHKEWLCCV